MVLWDGSLSRSEQENSFLWEDSQRLDCTRVLALMDMHCWLCFVSWTRLTWGVEDNVLSSICTRLHLLAQIRSTAPEC